MADLEDDMDVIMETSTVLSNKAESDSWNEIDLTPVNENPAMAMKKPLENSEEITDIADEKRIVIKENLQGSADQKSEVMITTSAVREAPARSLEKEKKEKIEHLAQLLTSSDIAAHKKQSDLTSVRERIPMDLFLVERTSITIIHSRFIVIILILSKRDLAVRKKNLPGDI
jgi:hypothetical protein